MHKTIRPAMVEKQKIINQIHDQITKAKTTIVVQYQGLDVSLLSELRHELKQAGAQIKVYKNNLVGLALKDSDFKDLDQSLIGPNAFVFGFENDLNTAKVLANFAKKNKLLKLKAGIFENKVIDQNQLLVIASLPPKEILLSMLLSALQGPIQKLAATIEAVAKSKDTTIK
ncbi:MAG: 50S ribosomal protein L10 [Spiroplasma sp.]|nr:50S ribosomal protein L10 [Spiroplasma sp.]